MRLMRGILATMLLIALASCAGDSVGPVTTAGATLLRHDLAPQDIGPPGAIAGELVLFNGCIASGLDPKAGCPNGLTRDGEVVLRQPFTVEVGLEPDSSVTPPCGLRLQRWQTPSIGG